MSKFAFLLHHAPDRYENLSEDELMRTMKDYIAWVEKTSSEGTYAGGHKLSSTVACKITSGARGIHVHDSPFTELTEILGGVMIVECESMDEAVEMAMDHPHLVHNTKIEIRLVDGEE